jgi:replicative DNA helicase
MFSMTNVVDVEATLIGSALVNKESQAQLLELEQDDMETVRGADVLSAIKLMRDAGQPVDLATLDAMTEGKYTEYLIGAAQQYATIPFYFTENIRLLKDKAIRRRVLRETNALINAMSDPRTDPQDAVGEAIDKLKTLSSAGSDRAITAREAVLSFASALDKKAVNRARFGVEPLDDTLGGLFGEKLVVAGARPGTGKSALAIAAAMETQKTSRVLFCSFEMKPEEIIGRMISNLSGVDSQKISYRMLGVEDYELMYPAMEQASRFNVVFRPSANTPSKIRAEAMKQNKDGKLGLIVIDYLQQMSSGQRAESRRVEVGQISRALKQLAMEIGVPVLALSQLNRNSEASASKAPTMSEMRESGDIEQDADVIILMHTPPANNDHVEQINDEGYACVRLTLEKNRQGKSGQVIDVAFDGARMAFYRAKDVIGRRK